MNVSIIAELLLKPCIKLYSYRRYQISLLISGNDVHFYLKFQCLIAS